MRPRPPKLIRSYQDVDSEPETTVAEAEEIEVDQPPQSLPMFILSELLSGFVVFPTSPVTPTTPKSSPYNRAQYLPFEILREIFKLALAGLLPEHGAGYETKMPPSSQFFTGPTRITYVCTRWRDVMLGLGEIWSTIVVWEPCMKHVPLVKLWLDRAKFRPLSLTLIHKGVRSTVYLDQICKMFGSRAEDWEHLHFEVDGKVPDGLVWPSVGRLYKLRSAITLFDDHKTLHWFWRILKTSRCLERVNWGVAYSVKQHGNLPVAQFTNITLMCPVTLGRVQDILRNSRRLVHLKVYRIVDRPEAETYTDDIVLDHLQHLALRTETDLTPLFAHLTTPSLINLEIKFVATAGGDEIGSGHTSLAAMLKRSKCPVKAFTLVDPFDSDHLNEVVVCFPCLRHVENLFIWGPVTDFLVRALTVDANANIPLDEGVMPRLQKIEMGVFRCSDGALYEMIRGRCQRRMRMLSTLTAHLVMNAETAETDRAELGSLYSKGLDLDIAIKA